MWSEIFNYCKFYFLHVTPVATSYHALTKAERFCRKFGNFFYHYLTLCVECFIRNYVSRVQKHSLPNCKFYILILRQSHGKQDGAGINL